MSARARAALHAGIFIRPDSVYRLLPPWRPLRPAYTNTGFLTHLARGGRKISVTHQATSMLIMVQPRHQRCRTAARAAPATDARSSSADQGALRSSRLPAPLAAGDQPVWLPACLPHLPGASLRARGGCRSVPQAGPFPSWWCHRAAGRPSTASIAIFAHCQMILSRLARLHAVSEDRRTTWVSALLT